MAIDGTRYRDLFATVDLLKKKAKAINKDWLLISCFLYSWLSDQTEDDEERYLLLTTLANEYRLYGLAEEAEKVFVRLAKLYATDPVPMLSLAGLKLHDQKDPKSALSLARTAVKRAVQADKFVRHAYSVQARAARALRDYALVEKSVEALLAYSPQDGGRDVKLEADLLNDLPKNAVKDELRRRYFERLKGR